MYTKTIKTVSIGIPAYNEETNIRKLLLAITQQEEKNFILEHIYIICDASTDKTVDYIKSFPDKRIILIENKTRKGQNEAENFLFRNVESDILVLFEADVLPQGTLYLTNLLTPIMKDNTIALVQGNMQPIPAKTRIGKTLTQQFSLYHHFVLQDEKLRYLWTSGRGGRALIKTLYKQLTLPTSVPEDSFIHLFCMQKKEKITVAEHAICRYACPQTFTDYLRERKKIAAGDMSLLHYFSQETIMSMYKKPRSIAIKTALMFLLHDPLHFLFYLYLKKKMSRYLKRDRFNPLWQTNNSTKDLSF